MSQSPAANPALSTNQEPGDAILPAPETQVVTSWKIACDGNVDLGLGHPRVWLAIAPATGFVDCGYCDKRFVIDPAAAHSDH